LVLDVTRCLIFGVGTTWSRTFVKAGGLSKFVREDERMIIADYCTKI